MDKSEKGCECSPSEENDKNSRSLKIKWKPLISKGETCPRCGSTEEEIEKALLTLKQSFAPLGINDILEKEQLSVTEFRKDPLQSNMIWINNRLLEDWIGGKVGHSPCCDVCGPHDCRIVEIHGQIYDTIPAEVIIKAGLSAASQLVSPETGESCCADTQKTRTDVEPITVFRIITVVSVSFPKITFNIVARTGFRSGKPKCRLQIGREPYLVVSALQDIDITISLISNKLIMYYFIIFTINVLKRCKFYTSPEGFDKISYRNVILRIHWD